MPEQEMTEPEAQTHPAEAAETRPPQPEAHYLPLAQPAPTLPAARTPLLAGFFSLFPGLGNIYNGLYLRGITFFLICFGLIGLAVDTQPPEAVLLVFTVIFTWFFNIFDAYRQATLINYGYTPDAELRDRSRLPTWGSGGLVAGVTVFVIGLYGFLRETYDIDLSLLADHWYLFFMAFGAVLIAQTIRQRRREAEPSTEHDGADLDL